VQSKLNSPDFVQKVPPNVLDDHRKRLADWQAKQQQVKAALDALELKSPAPSLQNFKRNRATFGAMKSGQLEKPLGIAVRAAQAAADCCPESPRTNESIPPRSMTSN